MPKDKPARKDGVSLELSYQSPIPPSNELMNYERITPGAGKAIIENFLAESSHRREVERRDQNLQGHIADKTTRQYFYGLIFGFVSVILVLGVGSGFMLMGHAVEGASVICSVIVGLAAAFIYGSKGMVRKDSTQTDKG